MHARLIKGGVTPSEVGICEPTAVSPGVSETLNSVQPNLPWSKMFWSPEGQRSSDSYGSAKKLSIAIPGFFRSSGDSKPLVR